MKLGIKSTSKNLSQLGIKGSLAYSMLGHKDSKMQQVDAQGYQRSDMSNGIISSNYAAVQNEPRGLYKTLTGGQSKPVVQVRSLLEKRRKPDRNGYNLDKNYVS